MSIETVSAAEFKERVSNGQKLIIFEGKVYDVTKWIHYHPGGYLPLSHMIGHDCTDQIRVFHPDWVINSRLERFFIGYYEVDNRSELSKDFLKLYDEIQSQGLEQPSVHYYAKKAVFLSFLFMSVWAIVLNYPQYWMMSAIVLAFFWHQAAFVAHDLGHSSVSQNSKSDVNVAIFLADFLGGLGIGWWKDSHYTHHVVTNDPEHDPDIQHLPFFAITEKFFGSLTSTYHEKIMKMDSFARFFVKFQSYLYYVIMFFARFNLYVQTYIFLFKNFKKSSSSSQEIPMLSLFWVWYGYLLSLLPSVGSQLAFLVISNGLTMMLHVQITMSHFAMSTETFPTEGEDFIEYQLRTTMDIDIPRWMDFYFGGLQFQAIHHLFPRVPRHNLRLVRSKVIDFCRSHKVEYLSVSFFTGNSMVMNVLGDVSSKLENWQKEQ